MSDNISILIQGGEGVVKDAVQSVIKDSLVKSGFSNVTSVAFNNEPIYTPPARTALTLMHEKFPGHFETPIQIAANLPVLERPAHTAPAGKELTGIVADTNRMLDLIEHRADGIRKDSFNNGYAKGRSDAEEESEGLVEMLVEEGFIGEVTQRIESARAEGFVQGMTFMEKTVDKLVAEAERQGYRDGRQDADIETAVGLADILNNAQTGINRIWGSIGDTLLAVDSDKQQDVRELMNEAKAMSKGRLPPDVIPASSFLRNLQVN